MCDLADYWSSSQFETACVKLTRTPYVVGSGAPLLWLTIMDVDLSQTIEYILTVDRLNSQMTEVAVYV